MRLFSGFFIADKIDGVVKSLIACVAAGSPNARRTTCTPPLDRHHCALYSKLLYVAIFGARLGFYEPSKIRVIPRSIQVETKKAREPRSAAEKGIKLKANWHKGRTRSNLRLDTPREPVFVNK
jgi:hypothetical protein